MTNHAASAQTARPLTELVHFTEMAARLIAHGKSRYDVDETLRLAAEAILHKIGEAVSRLPDEFMTDHPDVPWRSMKATRNLVAHGYEQIDYEILWNALANRLPAETQRIRAILSRIEPSGGA